MKLCKDVIDKEVLNDFLQFLVWSGSKENHGRMFPTLAINDWFGLKYGNEDLQIFPITDFDKLGVDDIIERFYKWGTKNETK